jgi:hypothetical protein
MARLLAIVVIRPLVALAALAAILLAQNPLGATRSSMDVLDDFKPTAWTSKVVKALK